MRGRARAARGGAGSWSSRTPTPQPPPPTALRKSPAPPRGAPAHPGDGAFDFPSVARLCHYRRMLRSRLRFGIFAAPFHATDENPSISLQRDRALIQWLDELGFDEAWVGEHHSAGY